jgi:hypothetical protein
LPTTSLLRDAGGPSFEFLVSRRPSGLPAPATPRNPCPSPWAAQPQPESQKLPCRCPATLNGRPRLSARQSPLGPPALHENPPHRDGADRLPSVPFPEPPTHEAKRTSHPKPVRSHSPAGTTPPNPTLTPSSPNLQARAKLQPHAHAKLPEPPRSHQAPRTAPLAPSSPNRPAHAKLPEPPRSRQAPRTAPLTPSSPKPARWGQTLRRPHARAKNDFACAHAKSFRFRC